MKHSANLEGLYKAARTLDPHDEAVRIIANRSNNPQIATAVNMLDPSTMKNPASMDVLEHMLGYMNKDVVARYIANIKARDMQEAQAIKARKPVAESLVMVDPYDKNNIVENPETFSKILNETLNTPLDSSSKNRAEEKNGREYYAAHNLAGIRPVSGAIGNIPFVDKLSVTKGLPLVPGAIGALTTGAITGLSTDSAAAGLSTGLGGAVGTLAGSYLADKLGFNLATDIALGGKLGALLGSGLGYAGHSILAGEFDKKKKKKDKENKKKD